MLSSSPLRLASFSITTPWNSSGILDDQLLHRLEQPFSVIAAGDDFGTRDAQLDPLPPHLLDQDAEVQLAAPRHLHPVRPPEVLHPQRDVRPAARAPGAP